MNLRQHARTAFEMDKFVAYLGVVDETFGGERADLHDGVQSLQLVFEVSLTDLNPPALQEIKNCLRGHLVMVGNVGPLEPACRNTEPKHLFPGHISPWALRN